MKKKILYVATVASHIKSFHLPYLKMMQDNGYKTYVVSNYNLNNNEKLSYCDKFIQLPIQRSPYSFKNLKAIKQLKKIVNEEKFDIIHCHTPMGGVVARLAARKARKKCGTRVIYTAHGFHFYKGAPLINWLLFYSVEKYLAKYTDTIITINKEDYELAKKKFSKRCKNIEYVPGVGIDTKKYDLKLTDKKKSDIRKSLGLKDNDFVMIFVARLDKNKNQGFLINVAEELLKEYDNIYLLLVGSDELNGYYQNMVKEKKIENNVKFLGFRKDIPELMSISNVAVSSSLREGLPVNVMEAFACGLPVVALNCRGMSDLIIDGKNGYLVDINNNCLLNFKNKIINLFCNYLSKNISILNKKGSYSYDIETIINLYSKIYFKKRR